VSSRAGRVFLVLGAVAAVAAAVVAVFAHSLTLGLMAAVILLIAGVVFFLSKSRPRE
jgi:hypothetical protein